MKRSNTFWVRICALLLTCLFCISLFGCADNNDNQEKPSGSDTAENTASAGNETACETTTDLPRLDFGGAEFRTISQESTAYDIWVEKQTGDPLNDAIYQRNLDIADRLNIKIMETVPQFYNELSTTVYNSVRAGSHDFDLVFGQMETTGADIIKGLFLNWSEINYVDFSNPWYTRSLIDGAATINEKIYAIVSDMSISYAEQAWMMVFNKKFAENNKIEDLYTVVRNKEWTLEKLNILSNDLYQDLNHDDLRDDQDQYGLVTKTDGCMLSAFFYASDQRFATVNTEDKTITTNLNSEKGLKISEMLHALTLKNSGSLNVNTLTNSKEPYEIFENGNTLFATLQAQFFYKNLRASDLSYGALPLPKYDTVQESYYTVVDAGCSVITIPTTVQNTDMIGAVVESMSAYSYQKVMPIYIDVCLTAKGIKDEESVEMFDLVMRGRVMDFAYLYDGWSGWIFRTVNLVAKPGSFTSTVKRSERKASSHYLKVLEYYYKGVIAQ